MSVGGYTRDDWDYAPVARGEEGEPDYSPDYYVRVWCRIDGCDWEDDEGDWQPDGPEGIYRRHWREVHAGKQP